MIDSNINLESFPTPFWHSEDGGRFNSRAIIDACRPFEWIDKFPHGAEADPAYLREIKAKWPSVFEGR